MFWLLGSSHLISHWMLMKTSKAFRQTALHSRGKIAEPRTFGSGNLSSGLTRVTVSAAEDANWFPRGPGADAPLSGWYMNRVPPEQGCSCPIVLSVLLLFFSLIPPECLFECLFHHFLFMMISSSLHSSRVHVKGCERRADWPLRLVIFTHVHCQTAAAVMFKWLHRSNSEFFCFYTEIKQKVYH